MPLDPSATLEAMRAEEDKHRRHNLAVAKEELQSLKPGSTVYQRTGPNIFFLSSVREAVGDIEKKSK